MGKEMSNNELRVKAILGFVIAFKLKHTNAHTQTQTHTQTHTCSSVKQVYITHAYTCHNQAISNLKLVYLCSYTLKEQASAYAIDGILSVVD